MARAIAPSPSISALLLGSVSGALVTVAWLVWVVTTESLRAGEPLLGAVLLAPLPFVSLICWGVVTRARVGRPSLFLAVATGVVVGVWVGTVLPIIGCSPSAENETLSAFSLAFGVLAAIGAELAIAAGDIAATRHLPTPAGLVAASLGAAGTAIALFVATVLYLGPLSCIVA